MAHRSGRRTTAKAAATENQPRPALSPAPPPRLCPRCRSPLTKWTICRLSGAGGLHWGVAIAPAG